MFLSVIAILVSMRAFYFTKRQTVIMETQEARKRRDDESTAEWTGKFDEAARAATSIASRSIFDHTAPSYVSVFPDGELRTRIQSYLIDADFGRVRFSARPANVEHLRMTIVQQTIQQVLDRVKELREREPENARKLGL